MLKNYFITALRNLKANRGFSILNVFGLSLGIFSAILIGLWINNELQYNKFHQKYDQIYQLLENQTYDGQTYTFPSQPGPLAPALKAEIPEIKNACRTTWGETALFSKGEKSLYEEGYFVDPSFLEIFSFPLLKGNISSIFKELNSIVITKEMADKFFPGDEAYGKTIKVDNEKEFVITGILADIPKNSTFKFNYLAPFKLHEQKNEWLAGWNSNGIQTFVELKPNTSTAALNKKLNGFIQKKFSGSNTHPFLFHISDWRLRNNFVQGVQSGGRIEYIRLFALIALIIILIACINFMNLATARAEKRAREIGVRKVLGAGKRSLIIQFFSESLVMAVVATLFACLLCWLLLPLFNKLIDKNLSLNLAEPAALFLLLSLALVCGFVSGSYPAFYLSSFKPVVAMKGMRAGRNNHSANTRKTLVVVQFIASIVLIICTIIISKQINYVKARNLGYDKDNLVYIPLNEDIRKNREAIKHDMLASGAAEGICGSNNLVLNQGSSSDGMSWKGKDPTKNMLVTIDYIDPDFVPTIGMKLKEGRNFYPDIHSDSLSIVVNESFAKLLNKKSVIGETVQTDGKSMQIIGVVNDFLYNNMYTAAQPLIFFCQPENESTFYIRLKKGNIESNLKTAESVLKRHDTAHPFDYKFLNDYYDRLFKSEVLVGNLTRLFAGMAIFISCIGLFGLAAYTAERRTKEIGVRKVLGASVFGIVKMLSADFTRLLFISMLIAFPIAWWLMHNWLQNYDYHTSISWWIFIIAGLLAFCISLITISFQSVKAALANPVKSLRTE